MASIALGYKLKGNGQHLRDGNSEFGNLEVSKMFCIHCDTYSAGFVHQMKFKMGWLRCHNADVGQCPAARAQTIVIRVPGTLKRQQIDICG
jgi:hypothetical protein